MVSPKSLFFVALCGAVYAVPVASNEAKELSPIVAKAVEVRDMYLASKAAEAYDALPDQKRSPSLPDGGHSKLEARIVTSGSFNIKWIIPLDIPGQDFYLSALVTFINGQPSTAHGTGVYASPLASTGNNQGIFRVSYLSTNSLYTAAARIIIDLATGAVLAAFDEGVEKNGAEVKSHLAATFKGS
ncbi:hypothetical protein PTMSG1_09068 [Pyrenophora teres f. maculata]|nr:hypothetical protein PTMSG1_09068 [Pyrenophora teres f. maculata]